MRMCLRIATSIVLGLGWVACKSESDPPVYLDLAYQLRCIDCEPRTSDDPEREAMLLDGEDDWKISCTVSSVGGKPAITLDAEYVAKRNSDSYGLHVTRAAIGSAPSDECKIRVLEGANTYEGGCTGEDPTSDSPCKVSFKQADNVVKGSIYCDKLPNGVNLSSYRYLVDPGTADEAVKLAIHNCEGL